MSLNDFRECLEKECKILAWNPSSKQLMEVALSIIDRTDSISPITIANIQQIVSNHVDGTRFILEEGIDNSDLKTLLLLATAVTKKVKN